MSLIDTALKNLISYYAGSRFVEGLGTTSTNVTASSSAPPQSSKDITPILNIIRSLCKKINTFVLLSVNDWGISHIQEENQSASRRLDDIARYRVAKKLQEFSNSQANGKICKLFGRKYIIWTKIWPTIKQMVLEDCASYPQVEELLHLFEDSIDGF
jgi:hypothetical protein